MKEHFEGFNKDFSKDQKKAVLGSLFLIAASDDEMHNKEEQFLEQTSMILDYPITRKFLDEVMGLGREGLINALISLNDSQKDWYITTAIGMVHADGKVLEEELQYLDVFFGSMEITKERAEAVMRKSQLLADMFQ